MFKLSRKNPSHTKTIEFNWVKKDFMNFKDFDDARERMGLRRFKKCFWCGHGFLPEDMMAIGEIIGNGNKFLCQECVKDF